MPFSALRLLPLLVLLLCAVHPGGGAAAEPFAQGRLWRIEAPGVPPSLVVGTLHANDRRAFRLPAAVGEALDASRVVVTELLGEGGAARFRAFMTESGPQLPGLLGEADYARVAALLDEAGVPEAEQAYFKPWAALLILAQPRDMRGPGLDAALRRDAERKGKEIRSLETTEEQIAALAELPEDTQLALLRHAAARYEAIQAVVPPMIDAYLAGDLAQIFRLNQEVMAGDPAIEAHNGRFLEQVLYARSRRFADRLEPLLREGGVFAFFGALHLYGDRGVLALLERKGFRVERLD